MGGFLIKIRKREAPVHSTIHKVYKGRYKRNRMQPYHDPALSVSPHQFLNGMFHSPFWQSLRQRPKEPYDAPQMPRRSKQEARSDLPPKVHTCYLVPLISL